MVLGTLLPSISEVELVCLRPRMGSIEVELRTSRPSSCCPVCGTASKQVHSRYLRTLGDLPGEGITVMSGQAGARLARRLGLLVSGSTLLRQLRHGARRAPAGPDRSLPHRNRPATWSRSPHLTQVLQSGHLPPKRSEVRGPASSIRTRSSLTSGLGRAAGTCPGCGASCANKPSTDHSTSCAAG